MLKPPLTTRLWEPLGPRGGRSFLFGLVEPELDVGEEGAEVAVVGESGLDIAEGGGVLLELGTACLQTRYNGAPRAIMTGGRGAENRYSVPLEARRLHAL